LTTGSVLLLFHPPEQYLATPILITCFYSVLFSERSQGWQYRQFCDCDGSHFGRSGDDLSFMGAMMQQCILNFIYFCKFVLTVFNRKHLLLGATVASGSHYHSGFED